MRSMVCSCRLFGAVCDERSDFTTKSPGKKAPFECGVAGEARRLVDDAVRQAAFRQNFGRDRASVGRLKRIVFEKEQHHPRRPNAFQQIGERIGADTFSGGT